jgi:hypothetical protein
MYNFLRLRIFSANVNIHFKFPAWRSKDWEKTKDVFALRDTGLVTSVANRGNVFCHP